MAVKVAYRDLGVVGYEECWDYQTRIFDAMVKAKTPSKTGGKNQQGPEIERVKGAESTGNEGEPLSADNGRASDGAGPGKEMNGAQEYGAGDINPAGAGKNNDPAEAGPVLILCEHPHVYTLGRSGHEANLLMGEDYLRSIGAHFVKIDRGGDITYHGPGQLVGYPILDIEALGLGLKEYIHVLEEAIIRTVAHYGITAGRSEGATGVWLEPGAGSGQKGTQMPEGPQRTMGAGSGQKGTHMPEGPQGTMGAGSPKGLRKIAAIGVRSSRFVTMHGFALNVSTDMRYFGHINPCGFTDRGVTSLEGELGRAPAMDEVKEIFKREFAALFGVNLTE